MSERPRTACIHPKLQLQLVVPEECLVRGDIGAWYKCERCGENFRTDIRPYVLEVQQRVPLDNTQAYSPADATQRDSSE